TAKATTRRLRFTEQYVDAGACYVKGQVADVPGVLAHELLRSRQAVETDAPLRVPVWAICARCNSSWIHRRTMPDGQWVQRWSDDADQSPSWAQCRCGFGWMR